MSELGKNSELEASNIEIQSEEKKRLDIEYAASILHDVVDNEISDIDSREKICDDLWPEVLELLKNVDNNWRTIVTAIHKGVRKHSRLRKHS